MKQISARSILLAAVMAASLTALSACSGTGAGGDPTDGGSSGETIKVGLLLPENQTARYEKFDRPYFEASVKENCPDCEVIYANAGNDAAKQAGQIDSMVAEGASVLAIFPVDGEALAASLSDAEARGVQTVVYGRPFQGPATIDMSIPLPELGAATAQPLKDALDEAGVSSGNIVMLSGDASYSGAVNIADGAKEVLGSGFTYAREYNVKNWDPAEAQKSMEQAITALGGDTIVGVYGMNDGIAGGAIAALKAAGVDPLPPVVGMDQEIAAIQRILVLEQLSSSSTGPIEQATAVGEVVAMLAQGEEPPLDGTVDHGSGEIDAIFFDVPDAVTIDEIQATLIDRGVYTYDEICTAEYVSACEAAGLTPAD